jgi:hypothetical protein
MYPYLLSKKLLTISYMNFLIFLDPIVVALNFINYAIIFSY